MLAMQEHRAYRSGFGPANLNSGWAERVEKIPGVLRFDHDTLPYLVSILERFHSPDPYMTCPAYHAFTGRRGLWGYAKGRSMVLFARHPNHPRQVLFYPQLGEPFPNLTLELIEKIGFPHHEYRLARYPSNSAGFIAASMNKHADCLSFQVQREDILDWAYPVHTLSTGRVLKAEGKQFKSFRYDLNRIDRSRIGTEPLDPREDIDELMGIIELWARSKFGNHSYKETIDVYTSLFEIMRHTVLRMMGLKFYVGGRLVAFEVWAMPLPGKKIANNLAGLNITVLNGIRGLSSYQHYAICQVLNEVGIDYVCIGGSECAGLDRFKRKMHPVGSLELTSIAVSLKQNRERTA